MGVGDETPSAPQVMSGLLDRIADRRPLDDALTDGRVRLDWSTYRDRAAALAGALRERGVRPGDRVAVHLPKSVDSFVAAHAVVRLGAVMVPVDWFAPPAYVGDVIGDAEPAAIVSAAGEERLREITGPAPGPVVVDPHAEDPPAPPADIDPASPAYIVYTSGSTGRPKGIVHTHASALAYARKAVATYGIDPADRLVNIAPLHFDQSTFELWAAPLAGAAVVVVPDGVLRFPASVSDLVAREKATVWYSVPFAITQLVTRGAVDDRDLTSLRWVLFGGESFPPASLAAAQRALPHARFSNVYGPAEVNQCTFHHLDQPSDGDDQPIDPDPAPADSVVPIGRPWADTEVLLVDAADQVIDGVGDGELLVSSDTMMEGYWRRPELTAASIGTRSDTGTRRWYRTGDLVRRRDDGTLVFLGRTDHQAKVRGYRIELEAIESVVAESPEVAACAVLVERGRDDRLVALVAPALDDEARASLLGLLRRRLPSYAVPAEILGVESLPRSGVGKVDRAAAATLLAGLRGEADHTVATPRPVG
jgi:amino acid adenylation domain-containing protein